MMRRFAIAGVLCLALVGCTGQARNGGPTAVSKPQLFDGLGNHRRSVTTSSPMAQQYFDQGLIWAFSFNHDEAIRSFTEAGRLDPGCAMAWWGVALCNGPHINNPIVDEAHAKAAWAALQQAQALKAGAGPTEQALIDALAQRYADPQPADRRPLDQAYADAMRSVWHANRGDADIGVLYAEALMDLQPWDLWTPDDQPKGNTPEILATLEEVLAMAPNHPGACHLYIHACEAGPNPAAALPAANRLRTLVPASGHMTHMPSHIDIRVGDWALAADQNERAIAAARAYRKRSPQQGFYRIYMAHNHHFFAFACMMEGRFEAGMQAAREQVASVPVEFAEQNPVLIDPFMMAPLDVLLRFGKWDEILREPAPPTYLKTTTSIWRLARGIAYAAKGDVASAEREQVAFRDAVERVAPDTLLMINKARHMLEIADHMLTGEIHIARGRLDDAAAAFRAGIALEDKLLYMEPPEWMHPLRHPLGAVLLAAGRPAEAEQVYRDDLKYWPENGWSLHGLATCLRARGATTEAADVEARFAKIWSRADTKIDSSCLCVPGPKADAAAAGRTADADTCCLASSHRP